jgi:hypothetical protein
LGYPVFEPPAASPSRPDVHLFFCRRGGAEATGVYNEDGFVVLAGSNARPEMLESASASLRAQREELIDSGAIVVNGSSMSFQRDTAFPSPSTAASVVCGGSANGWIEWKDESGRTLDQVYRPQED